MGGGGDKKYDRRVKVMELKEEGPVKRRRPQKN
jgi:hypothetical protein